MSLCPFSSSTSNIAFGSACETTASITTACSFWSPSSRSVLRAFSGRRGPLRWLLNFPKTRESLLGARSGSQTRLDLLREILRHAAHHHQAAHRLHPARPFGLDDLGHQPATGIEVAGHR